MSGGPGRLIPRQKGKMMMSNMSLDTRYELIDSLLMIEEAPAPQGPRNLETQAERRRFIQRELGTLRGTLNQLYSRYQNLDPLPPLELIGWAQAVLSFENLVVLVLDTTGLSGDADIIRVLIANRERPLFDQIISSDRQHHPNTLHTGITQEQFDAAPTLMQVWPRLQDTLTGKYVLSYNLDWVETRLQENAHHYGLTPLTIIGVDLAEKARLYWGMGYLPKRVDLCRQLGHPLPQPSTAMARVMGDLDILHAMSQGITGAPQPSEEEEEDHPF